MNYLTENDDYYEMLGEMLEGSPGKSISHSFKELAHLANTIKNASDDYEEAVKKYNTGSFESRLKHATLTAYKHSFAIMTNTVISGMHFNQLLEKYQND